MRRCRTLTQPVPLLLQVGVFSASPLKQVRHLSASFYSLNGRGSPSLSCCGPDRPYGPTRAVQLSSLSSRSSVAPSTVDLGSCFVFLYGKAAVEGWEHDLGLALKVARVPYTWRWCAQEGQCHSHYNGPPEEHKEEL
eukprot:2172869-Rhodomonas_salina.2